MMSMMPGAEASGPFAARRLHRAGRALLLLGLERWWLDLVLSGLVLGVLCWSRLAWLASGPWEWDETLFAHGLVKFSLAAHFPHPPGFPGWLAIGKLLLALGASSPLRALQLASAGLSVVALWPLIRLGRKVAAAEVAVLASLLVLLLPGPWLHAVRGFSSTPAMTFALAAAALAASGLHGRRLTGFTLLVAAAFLIRPILLPPLSLLWLCVVVSERPAWRRLLPGVSLAVAAGVVAVALMAHAEGGWTPFIEAFVTHGSHHLSRLVENLGGLTDLGMVKGAGGAVAALILLVAAALGVSVWWRRVGIGPAVLWVIVLAALAAQLVLLQNRTYSRYAVALHLALAPLVAGAASVLPRRVAVAVLGGLVVVAGWSAWPLVAEQHQTLLPGWEAVCTAADEARGHEMAVVVEPGLHPFASYLWHVRGGGELAGDPHLVLSPWAPEPWAGVDRPYLVATDHPDRYLPPIVGGERRFGGVSARLQPLTQQRFLEAAVLAEVPLPISGWWMPEQLPSGERFMWGSADAELVLPPLPPQTRVEIDLRPAAGDAPLELEVNGRQVAALEGRAPRSRLWIEAGDLRTDQAQHLVLRRAEAYRPGGSDTRPLAVQLLGCRAVGPGVGWSGSLAEEPERNRLGAHIEGAYPAETFGAHGRACWLRPEAHLELPAGPGLLRLALWAPRPVPSQTSIRLAGRVLARPDLGNQPVNVELHLDPAGPAGHGRVPVVLEIESVPYVPAEHSPSTDRRELGVVLQSASFTPEGSAAARWAWR